MDFQSRPLPLQFHALKQVNATVKCNYGGGGVGRTDIGVQSL